LGRGPEEETEVFFDPLVGLGVVRKFLFFFSKFRCVVIEAAFDFSGGHEGMAHLVVEDGGEDKGGDLRLIKDGMQGDGVGARIITSKPAASPDTPRTGDSPREAALDPAFKIETVEFSEKGEQVVLHSLGSFILK